MKATELVEKLKNVFLSEEVAQDEVKDVEVQAEVVSAELEAQTEGEEVVAEGLAEAPVASPEDEMSPEDVVEDIADQWSIENSNIFQGYFHILGGTISSVGQRKEDLLINSLVERVNRENIEEVILATSATVEGQTTAYYIQDSLKNTNAKITKLAQGLPVGGEIENLDDGTLFSAFKNRTGLKS